MLHYGSFFSITRGLPDEGLQCNPRPCELDSTRRTLVMAAALPLSHTLLTDKISSISVSFHNLKRGMSGQTAATSGVPPAATFSSLGTIVVYVTVPTMEVGEGETFRH